MKVGIPKMTIEELDRLPDDFNRYELIDGQLYASPTPPTKHQMVSATLLVSLSLMVKERDQGLVLPALIDVYLGPQTRVEPDIIFVARERLHLVKENGLFGAPDLVVEILSEATWHVDPFEKLDLYRSAGVQEYWIADPYQRTVTVHRFAESGEPRKLGLDDTLTSPLFPGLEIPLRAVFDY